MTFKDDIKVKDYFMKDYTRTEIVDTFRFMIGRMGRTGEIEGELQDIKIIQIDGNIITVETKMKDTNEIRLYRVGLEFNQMENEEFTREAKIKSPERYGEIVEIKKDINNEEKTKYFEGVKDYWYESEEIEARIERQIETSNFIEKYGQDNITKVVDIMLQNSVNSGEILGEVLERKIVKIEDTTVSVAIKTKDDERVRVYRLNIDFDRMKKIGYTDKAKVESPMRIGFTKELQSDMSNREKENYYDRLKGLWEKDENVEEKEE